MLVGSQHGFVYIIKPASNQCERTYAKCNGLPPALVLGFWSRRCHLQKLLISPIIFIAFWSLCKIHEVRCICLEYRGFVYILYVLCIYYKPTYIIQNVYQQCLLWIKHIFPHYTKNKNYKTWGIAANKPVKKAEGNKT